MIDLEGIVSKTEGERTPGFKLLLTILVGAALAIPLFSVWLLVYDRQTQSEQAGRLVRRCPLSSQSRH